MFCNKAFIKINKLLSRGLKSLHEHFQGQFTITNLIFRNFFYDNSKFVFYNSHLLMVALFFVA